MTAVPARDLSPVAPPVILRPSTGRAIALVIVAVTLFSLSDVLAKRLSEHASTLQVGWLRYVAFAVVAVAMASRARFAAVRARRPGLQVARGVAVLGSGLLFILGLERLGVAEATAVAFVAPTFITGLSILVLKEVVGLRRWIAVGLGLAGVLLVVRPGGGAFQPAALFPLASAFCGAAGVVITRKMGADDRAETTLLWSALIGAGGLTAMAPLWLGPIGLAEFGLGLAMGALYGLGQYLLIRAYSSGEVSVLAPFSYAQLIASTALGYLVFRHAPDGWALAGMGVIMLSGGYTLHREYVRRRRTSAGG
jgi:drug/metabolite transporter (DMT)-like permease